MMMMESGYQSLSSPCPSHDDDYVTADDDGTFHECDYEQACTELYKALEDASTMEDYEAIQIYLDTGRWTGNFRSFASTAATNNGIKSIKTPDEQVSTWVSKFDGETLVWSQLPLHIAVTKKQIPTQLLRTIIEMYPQAVRSTNANYMLPLHLALQAGNVSDEIIAFLLLQFPAAVNKRCIDNRSAVEYALEGGSQLGTIIELFTMKTTEQVLAPIEKENKELKLQVEEQKAELEKTTQALDERSAELVLFGEKINSLEERCSTLGSGFTALKTKESDLLSKIEKLEKEKEEMEKRYKEEMDHQRSETLLQELVTQEKINLLMDTIQEKTMAEEKANADKEELKASLEALQSRVVELSDRGTLDDIKHLQHDLDEIRAYQLERTRTETKDEVSSLKDEVDKSVIAATTSVDDDENNSMGSSRKSFFSSGSLSFKSIFSSTGSPTSNGTREMSKDLMALKNKIDQLSKVKWDEKSANELKELKDETDELRNKLKERELLRQTKSDLHSLRNTMALKLKSKEGKTDDDMKALRNAIHELSPSVLDGKTVSELVAMKSEYEKLVGVLSEHELETTTRKETESLMTELNREVSSTGSTTVKAELSEMKKAVESLQHSLQGKKSRDELIAVKREMETLKENFRKKNASTKIASEADTIQAMIESKLKSSEGKTQNELLNLKRALRDITEKSALEEKNADELAQVREELMLVKEELKEVERISKTHQELEEIKKTLEEEIKASQGKTDEELQALKQSLEEIKASEPAQLKETLENEIKSVSGMAEQELQQLKETISLLDIKKLEAKNNAEVDTMRKEIDVLKAFLKKANSDSIDATEKRLRDVQATVATMDQVESQNREQFVTLQQEMNELRLQIQRKQQSEELLKKDLELLKQAKLNRQNSGVKGLKKLLSKSLSFRKSGSSKLSSSSKPNVDTILEEGALVDSPAADIPSATSDPETTEATILPPQIRMKDPEIGTEKPIYSSQNESNDDSAVIKLGPIENSDEPTFRVFDVSNKSNQVPPITMQRSLSTNSKNRNKLKKGNDKETVSFHRTVSDFGAYLSLARREETESEVKIETILSDLESLHSAHSWKDNVSMLSEPADGEKTNASCLPIPNLFSKEKKRLTSSLKKGMSNRSLSRKVKSDDPKLRDGEQSVQSVSKVPKVEFNDEVTVALTNEFGGFEVITENGDVEISCVEQNPSEETVPIKSLKSVSFASEDDDQITI